MPDLTPSERADLVASVLEVASEKPRYVRRVLKNTFGVRIVTGDANYKTLTRCVNGLTDPELRALDRHLMGKWPAIQPGGGSGTRLQRLRQRVKHPTVTDLMVTIVGTIVAAIVLYYAFGIGG